MAKITKTKAGTYTTRIYIGRDPSGKQLFEHITRDSWHDCSAAANQMLVDIENRTFSNVGNEKFASFADKWLKLKEPPELKTSTYRDYKMYVNTHFKPYFGNIKLNKITDLYIKQYIAEKLKSGLSSETVRKHFVTLNCILNDALKTKNPCKDIKPPKKSKYKPYVLSDKEFALIHAAVKGTLDELPVLLSAWCGLRLGEICALKWNDINKENGTIRIDEALSITDEGNYNEDVTKSTRGMRTIAAPEEIFTLIEEQRKRQKAISERIFTMRPDGYSGRFGGLIDDHNKALKDVLKGMDIPTKGQGKKWLRRRSFNLQEKPLPDIRFHDLRHYHASTLYKNGISDQYAADRLGHDIIVLKKIYQHLQEETISKEDEKVKNIYKKPGT